MVFSWSEELQAMRAANAAKDLVGEVFAGYNPDTGEPWAQITQGTAEDADRAVREYLQVKSIRINTGAVTGKPFAMR
ncbi:MAG: hypothetical protein EPO19_15275 [Betaproteobacteria bacterium]|nr:MAG: hypothetical protein EPO19_15275 [Betaproteobacteria bacterium]